MNVFKKPISFFKEALLELKKVHWPTRKEAIALTGAVLVVATFYSLLLSGMDFSLSEILFKIIIR